MLRVREPTEAEEAKWAAARLHLRELLESLPEEERSGLWGLQRLLPGKIITSTPDEVALLAWCVGFADGLLQIRTGLARVSVDMNHGCQLALRHENGAVLYIEDWIRSRAPQGEVNCVHLLEMCDVVLRNPRQGVEEGQNVAYESVTISAELSQPYGSGRERELIEAFIHGLEEDLPHSLGEVDGTEWGEDVAVFILCKDARRLLEFLPEYLDDLAGEFDEVRVHASFEWHRRE